MFRTVPLSIMSTALYTQQWYMSYRFADSLLAGSGRNILILLAGCQQTCMYCCVYSEKTHDDGQRNRLKRVGFYPKSKFEKLVYLICFIIRIYHDARSPERKKSPKINYGEDEGITIL